ncbi:hypothetical protein HD806DRAFT_540176 [Xylariaceae sp. AK1471]|nr:hypothetical protein HD806DRAFT_540176 [Xylariaceae sp. AK1471]
MPAPANIQAATLDKFISGWKKWSPEAWMATWSQDCKQQLLPFSLGVPYRSKAETQVFLPKLMGVLTNYKMDVHEIVHDVARSKAAIYIISTADTPWEDFKWTNEYAVFVTFTEDGTEINSFKEMVDTAFFQQFFPRFQKFLAEQGDSH